MKRSLLGLADRPLEKRIEDSVTIVALEQDKYHFLERDSDYALKNKDAFLDMDLKEQGMMLRPIYEVVTDDYDSALKFVFSNNPQLVVGSFQCRKRKILNPYKLLRDVRVAGKNMPFLICNGPYEPNSPWSLLIDSALIAVAYDYSLEEFAEGFVYTLKSLMSGVGRKVGGFEHAEADTYSLIPQTHAKIPPRFPYFIKIYNESTLEGELKEKAEGLSFIGEQRARDAQILQGCPKFKTAKIYANLVLGTGKLIEFQEFLSVAGLRSEYKTH